MRHEARHHAMTLLEVVLAIALSVGVMGAAIAFYRQAVEVRRSLEDKMRLVEAQRLVMDRIANELRSAFAHPFLQMGMEGQAGELRFISARLPGPAAWAIKKSTDDPIRPEYDLEIVGYRLRFQAAEEGGSDSVVGLERTSQKLLTAPQVEEENLETSLVSGAVKFIGLRYWQQGVWLPSWADERLPRAVEITLGASPLPEDTEPQDYPYEAFRRVVYLQGAGT